LRRTADKIVEAGNRHAAARKNADGTGAVSGLVERTAAIGIGRAVRVIVVADETALEIGEDVLRAGGVVRVEAGVDVGDADGPRRGARVITGGAELGEGIAEMPAEARVGGNAREGKRGGGRGILVKAGVRGLQEVRFGVDNIGGLQAKHARDLSVGRVPGIRFAVEFGDVPLGGTAESEGMVAEGLVIKRTKVRFWG
jgi:hypothetical protein